MYQQDPDVKKSKMIFLGLLVLLGIIMLFKFKEGMEYNSSENVINAEQENPNEPIGKPNETGGRRNETHGKPPEVIDDYDKADKVCF